MSPDPFPKVSSGEELDDVWTATYVECAGCIDPVPVKDGMDPVEWAKGHMLNRSWHNRFRILKITNFSVPADASDGYPDQPYSDVP